MKNLLLLGIIGLCFGCSSEDNEQKRFNDQQLEAAPENKVALLKVDFLTNAFEGGKELTFASAANFNIASEYQSPADFGGITLKYAELNQTFFEGTIFWNGLGQMTYPSTLADVNSFPTIINPVEMPSESMFATVNYTEFPYYPETIPYTEIWNAVHKLQIVAQFRASNPNSQVNLFLYTPSVGIGDPADWDWFVILKN